MLKQLKLRAELKQRKNELAEILRKKEDFKKRQQELDAALGEAETEEDISLIEGQINELEKEITEEGIDEKETTLNSEIERIEGELADTNSRTEPPRGDHASAPAKKEERGGITTMKNRGIFYSINGEERRSILESEEVKGFLTRCRELKLQKREVSGAELSIPEVFLGIIRDNLHKYSKLLSKVNLKPVKGDARQLIAGTIPEGVWTEMVASINELTISFNQVEVDGYKVGGYIAIPDSILEDSDLSLAAEIVEGITQALGLALDKAVLYGTGKRMPTGIITRLAQTGKPEKWSSNMPEWTDLHTSNIVKLDRSSLGGTKFFSKLTEKLLLCRANYSDGNMFWCMNTKTRGSLMAEAITFNAAGALTSSISNTMPFVGGDIIVLDFIPDGDIVGGYGSLYLLAERAGIKLANSDIPRFLQDETVFKGTARYDGMPVFGEGFVLINIDNTNPTTSITFAGDEVNTELVSLSKLEIGATPVTLYPPFNKDTLNYRCEVSAHSNKIAVAALQSDATISIKNGETAVENGKNATFAAGENILSIEVSNGNAKKRTYTVVVKDVTT